MSACDSCGAPLLVDALRGEAVCSECQLVSVEPMFDYMLTKEDKEKEPSIVVHTGVSETRIYASNIDAGGGRVSEETRARLRHLSWVDTHAVTKRDRSLKKLTGVLYDVCRKLQVSNQLRDRAFYIAKRAYEKGIMKNQEFSLLAGASIKLAAQEAKVYMNDKTLLAVLNISRQRPLAQLQRAYRTIKRGLMLSTVSTKSESLLPIVRTKLSLPIEVQRKTRELLDGLTDRHRPEVDLVPTIYVASRMLNHGISQADIVRACGTSDVSLRARVKKTWPETFRKELV